MTNRNPVSMVQKILRKILKFDPYKRIPIQELLPGDINTDYIDVRIIPPNESGNITENEDINGADLGEIILRDVTGEDIHGKNSMPQLEFRQDITMNMLCSKPKLISQPGPKILVPTEIRKTDKPFLKSASQE
ncbi:hypothetical protein NPIL_323761 [Nephila pilipes]|uniref:Uncharacterized protein n=1 Tax=Nephila pilipes TaxID=299642 RepID=A0A8X6QNF8_NEPPI|nr:hypothetical protein NPIL_323761 [Nephila pilipes]